MTLAAVLLTKVVFCTQVVDEALALVKKDIASVEDELQKLAKASANTSVCSQYNKMLINIIIFIIIMTCYIY